MSDAHFARALGWLSIGLGLSELIAPRKLSHLMGIRERWKLLRALGLRESATGIGILAQRSPASWLWARVAGDVIDLLLLGSAFRAYRSQRKRVMAATGLVAGVTLLDLMCSQRLSAQRPSVPV